ncbi:MAG: hypothetical protein CMJ94_07595 [Planctomycetes bacterium]|nr:hypothetical protein [Planctomycetota bacterium]
MSLLLIASFQAALLALAVFVLERSAGRWLTPGLRLALWSLVPLRLLLVLPIQDPFGAARPLWWTWEAQPPSTSAVEGESAASPLTPSTPAESGNSTIASAGAPVVAQLPGQGKEEFTAERSSSPSPIPAGPTAPSTPVASGPRLDLTPPQAEPAEPAAPSAPHNSEPSSAPSTHLPSWLFWLWLGGVSIALLRTLRAEVSLRRHLRAAQDPIPSTIQQLTAACAQQLGLRRVPQVVLVDGLPSPAAHGWRRGQLLLPHGIEHELDEEELRFVLLHELAHLRHHDGLQNLLLAVLAALHWFNPLVAYAHHRMREERELLRDQEALAALPHVPARRCAATLVKLLPRQQPAPAPTSLSALLPHHQTTRRRISMIIQPWQPKRLQLLPGVACVAVLAWAGLTQSSAQSGSPPGPSAPSSPRAIANGPAGPSAPSAGPRKAQIRVTRQRPQPEWHAPTLARLQGSKVKWFDAIALEDFAEMIKATTELEVRIDEDLLFEIEEFGALRVEVTLDRALDLLCQVYPMRWTLEDGGLKLNHRHESPDDIELRFYDVVPLIGASDERGDHLQDVLHELTHHGEVWDWEGVGMRLWNGQLLVQQSPDVHARIEQVLNMLLDRHSEPIPAVPAEHRALFLQRTHVEEGTSMDDFLGEVFAEAGIPLLVHPDYAGMDFEDDYDFIQLQSLLQEVVEHTGGRFTYHQGVVYFGDRIPMSTSCYEISDLITASDAEIDAWSDDEVGSFRDEIASEIRDEKTGNLMDLLYEMVDPELWEVEGPSMLIWDGLLLITQSNRAHGEIASFLETARRAVRR